MFLSSSHCDGCGLAIEPGGGTECPRCGYPITDAKEEAFLQMSLYNLQRVAQYGGANITVAHLIDRYLRRLAFLSQHTASLSLPAHSQQVPDIQVAAEKREAHENTSYSHKVPRMGVSAVVVLPGTQGVQVAPSKPMFSARAFFADQTINIVASLGAFLILIGSLSFIATTSDLLLAFIVLLVVHAIFGSIGAITYRFASLRTVSVIYTAIFTLQVPLVGFAAYRVVAGSEMHVSTSLLIAIAAGYAAGAYGVLAVYQKFKPFGYLAVVALFVMDLAASSALLLTIWWWSSMLMLLAFPLLILVRRPDPLATIHPSPIDSVLRAPARILVGVCVACSTLYATAILLFGALESLPAELRLSVVVILLLLSGWFVLFIWCTKYYELMGIIPYLLMICMLALCYDFYISHLGYVLALTALAFLFCGLARLDLQLFKVPGNRLVWNLEVLALLLVGSMPFIAAPGLLIQIVEQAYFLHRSIIWAMPFEIVMDVVLLLLGCVVTLTVLTHHTGWRKVLTAGQTKWCWLLLLCGFIFNYTYALVAVTLAVVPVWAMLGFFLLCISLAVWARRFLSVSWANPLDVLSICVGIEILPLSLSLDQGSSIVLLLFMSGIFYILALYQKRQLLFLLSIVCTLIALPYLHNMVVLLPLALLLPLVSAGIHRTFLYKQSLTHPDMSQQQLQRYAFVWEWPLLLISIVYGVSLAFYDSATGVRILEHWLVVPIVAVLGALALVWYVAGLLAQKTWWAGVAIGFAMWGILLIPQTVACQSWVYDAGTHTTECVRRGQLALYELAGIVLFGAASGLYIDWLARHERRAVGFYRQIKWSWPSYVVSLGAIVTLLLWSGNAAETISLGDVLTILCGLSILVLAVMLVMRVPEILILVAILAVRIIAFTPWSLWQQMSAYSVLCVCLFAAQFIWRFLEPAYRLFVPACLSAVLAFGGQLLVVLVIIVAGGLFASAGVLAQVGAGSLAVFALLLLWWGCLQTMYTIRWSFVYMAGLVGSLAVSWELSALAQTQLSTLWLAPAAYLIVIAPFLSHDERLPVQERHLAGQLCSIAGAIFLLLPTLWLSFSQNNLQPSLLLTGESLLLLLLGLVTRIRFFILSSVGLIIVTAIHVLFLPSLGIPTFLALLLMGIFLLVAATALVLVRSRLAVMWTKLE